MLPLSRLFRTYKLPLHHNKEKAEKTEKKKSTSLLGSIKEKKTEQTAGPKNGETGKYRESQLTEQRPLKHKWLQESEPGRKT